MKPCYLLALALVSTPAMASCYPDMPRPNDPADEIAAKLSYLACVEEERNAIEEEKLIEMKHQNDALEEIKRVLQDIEQRS